MGHSSITRVDDLGDALMDGDNATGEGNTVKVAIEDDVEEDDDAETELVTVERTEEPVAVVEELVVVEVTTAEADVMGSLQSILVSHEKDIN